MKSSTPPCTLLLCFALVAAAPVAADSGGPVAMVTEVNGAVQSNGATLPLLAELAPGSTIELPAEATVVVVFLAGGLEFRLNGPARAVVEPTIVRVKDGEPPEQRQALGVSGISINPAGKAQASFSMRADDTSGDDDILLRPTGEGTLSRRPAFRWRGVEGAEVYTFELFDDDLEPIVETTTENTFFELPAGIELMIGADYSWHVETTRSDTTHVSCWRVFRVATEAEIVEVERLRPAPGASSSDHVVFAFWLRQHGWLDAARDHLEMIQSKITDMLAADIETPWTLSYHDGSGNGFVFSREDATNDVQFKYMPVEPATSSSGTYSGGAAVAGLLDDQGVQGLWRWYRRFEAGSPQHVDRRTMLSGSFRLHNAGNSRAFVVGACPALREFERELVQMCGL